MSEENELPAGWVRTTIGNVAAINPGVNIATIPDSTLISFVPMASVEAGTGRMDTSTQRQLSEVKRGYTAFLEGDVLFAKITPCMENGKSAVARSLSSGIGFGSTEFHVLRPSSACIDPQLLYYYVSQESFRQAARALMTGSAGQLRVPAAFLVAVPYPLAPLPEQHRIVAAIEQQFSRLDAGVAALRRAQAKLKRYRAAVLKAAVEGKLTEVWRAEHPTTEPATRLLERILVDRRARWEADLRAKGKDAAKVRYVEAGKADGEGLSEVPEGWCWATVEQVGDVQLGRQRAPQHHTGNYMRPYLRVANVFEDRIDVSDVMTMNFTPEAFEVYRLKFGDILLNEGQSLELIGRPAMYRDEVPNACFQNTLVRFQVYPGLFPEYALSVFRVYMHTKRFQRIGRHTTNIAHLGAGRFAVLEFPLPPLAEQQQIVAEVEQRLSVVSQLEATVAANLKRAERLRQSILKEAFAGRLVRQDASDEPAGVLLERIRGERDERKNGVVHRGRVVGVAEAVKIDVGEMRQVELWSEV